ncbi:hypothetical protein HK101_010922, partial [Irineochytrium annulatum]
MLFSTITLLVAAASTVSASITCEVTNWHKYDKEIAVGDFLLNWAQKDGIVQVNIMPKNLFLPPHTQYLIPTPTPTPQSLASKFQPLQLENVKIPTISTKLIGKNWDFDAVVDNVSLTGLNTISVNPLNVTAPTVLGVGGSMGTLNIKDAKIAITITQQTTKWAGHDCWKPCAPRKLEFTTSMTLTDASISALLDLQVMECGGSFWNNLLCKIASGWDFVKSVFKGQVKQDLLKRFKSANINALDI